MDGETTIDVLIGTLLLLVLAAICIACVGAFGLALYAVNVAVNHYVPAAADAWNIKVFGTISLVLLIVCVRQLLKRRWTNAFLSSAAVVTIILPWLLNANPHPGLDGTILRFPLQWFIALILPQTIRVSRAEFTACASIITGAFAINIGLLRPGFVETLFEISLCIVIMRWILVKARDGRYGDPWGILSIFSPRHT